ncbi:unnamed protein product [Symbiodinium natans]|uniref:SAP domain-containing protein n=1 Tax=Symbiodinium natans TaxID=878477 RepID=A0A812URQ8_9DINO|nr:unnamed protein product [Symbiodinium natans]
MLLPAPHGRPTAPGTSGSFGLEGAAPRWQQRSYRTFGAIPLGVAAAAFASGKAASQRPGPPAARAPRAAGPNADSLGAMTELLLRLRSSEPSTRDEMLQEESEKGLKAICAGLGLKRSGGSEDELRERIEEALLEEDKFYAEDSPVLRIIEVLGNQSDAERAMGFLVDKYRAVDLKDFCKALQMPISGTKASLAERIAAKAGELSKVLHAKRAGSVPSAQATETKSRRRRPAEVAKVMEEVKNAEFAEDAGGDFPEVADAEVMDAEEVEPPQAAPGRRKGARASRSGRPAAVEAIFEADAKVRSRPDASQEEYEIGLGQALVDGPDDFDEDESTPPELPSSGNFPQPGAEGAPSELVDEEDDQRKQRRFIERRQKLMGYVVEEGAAIYGSQKEQYLEDLNQLLKDAPTETKCQYLNDKLEEPTHESLAVRFPEVLGPARDGPEFAAWHVEPYQEEMQMVGELGPARVAWCQWWDRVHGCGQVVDYTDKAAVNVVSAALTTGANVHPQSKYLTQGEFVEYRRVEEPEGNARAILVRGVKGWPLACEVASLDPSRALPGD